MSLHIPLETDDTNSAGWWLTSWINFGGSMVISAFLVEDKPDIRRTLVEAMEEIAPLRFVGHADSETGARQWLGAHEADWDLAIVDLFLAEGSGFGVLKDCQRRTARQKVIVLTSHSQENLLARCRELGADEVFDKSHDVEKLVRFCRNHAESLDGKLPPTQ
jgi:DNA-binding NarL/FixJ family response regulator